MLGEDRELLLPIGTEFALQGVQKSSQSLYVVTLQQLPYHSLLLPVHGASLAPPTTILVVRRDSSQTVLQWDSVLAATTYGVQFCLPLPALMVGSSPVTPAWSEIVVLVPSVTLPIPLVF